MSDVRVVAILTSFNRRDVTLACIAALQPQLQAAGHGRVVLVDDGSTDGTSTSVHREFPDVVIEAGDGSLFWGGGMRLAERQALERFPDLDYLLWVNDDADINDDALAVLLHTANGADGPSIVCSAFTDPRSGETTYSGVKRARSLFLTMQRVAPGSAPQLVDSFNGNLVLVHRKVVEALGGIGPFTHHYGDFDYGMRARDAGFPVLLAPGHQGQTARNPSGGTYRDRSLTQRQRVAHLFGPKGYPWREKLTYLRRHGGILWPVQYVGVYAAYLLRIALSR